MASIFRLFGTLILASFFSSFLPNYRYPRLVKISFQRRTLCKKQEIAGSKKYQFFNEIYVNFNMIFGPLFNNLFIHFSIFSQTPPGDHFWRVQAPVYTQKCDFGAILGFRGEQNRPLGRPFRPKKLQRGMVPNPGERPGSDPAPNDPPKQVLIDFS